MANSHKLVAQADAHAPAVHATTHQPTGSDAMAVDAAQATGSLRTITTSAAQAIGTAAAGAGTAAASSNHVHATGAGTPTTQALGDAAATGSGPAAAMTDHKHAMPSATVGSSGLTMATAKLLGRSTAATGAIETITLGTNLSFSGTTLNASSATGPGSELDYVEITSGPTITATSEATATTVVTGNGVAYDGSTVVDIEFFAAYAYINTNTAGKGLYFYLYDGSSSIGLLSYEDNPTTTDLYTGAVRLSRRLTPSAATHTYGIRASKDSGGTTTVSVAAGAGGVGVTVPAFIRITKV